MNSGELTVQADHLDRIVKSDVVAGLAELIWNSLDAEATTINVDIHQTPLGGVDNVVVTDDGHGFGLEEVQEVMASLGGSWKATKADRKTKNGARLLHGNKGEGRFRAFALGDRVRWESVISGDDGNSLTEFTIRRSALKRFEWSTTRTEKTVGTRVTVMAGTKEPNILVTKDGLTRLLKTLAVYLTQYPDVAIRFNGAELDPRSMIERQDDIPIDYCDIYGPLGVTVIEWIDPSVRRRLYLCDASGATLYRVDAGIQAPRFNFTAYAKWDGFRAHEEIPPVIASQQDANQAT